MVKGSTRPRAARVGAGVPVGGGDLVETAQHADLDAVAAVHRIPPLRYQRQMDARGAASIRDRGVVALEGDVVGDPPRRGLLGRAADRPGQDRAARRAFSRASAGLSRSGLVVRDEADAGARRRPRRSGQLGAGDSRAGPSPRRRRRRRSARAARPGARLGQRRDRMRVERHHRHRPGVAGQQLRHPRLERRRPRGRARRSGP